MIAEAVFCLMYVVIAAMNLWAISQLKQFLKDTPSISNGFFLERFKAMARIQMYLALGAIPVLLIGGALGILLISRYGIPALAVVLPVNGLFIGLGMYTKSFETKARNLETNSDVLAQEYRNVCEAWVKKALPDF